MVSTHRIVELMANEAFFCLVTIIASDDPGLPVGRNILVLSDETMEGETACPDLNLRLRDLAMVTIRSMKSRVIDLSEGVTAFFDFLSADVKLLICGAGHVAVPLARLARDAGFKVTVLDDRSDFANISRFPDCRVIVGDFTAKLRNFPLGPSAFVVVITRGHSHDVECLTEILPKQTAYVGLIGSRRRVNFVIQLLSAKGMAIDRIGDVFTPIGLPIGSESPEEIAISIVAELVCVRRKGPASARSLRAAGGVDDG